MALCDSQLVIRRSLATSSIEILEVTVSDSSSKSMIECQKKQSSPHHVNVRLTSYFLKFFLVFLIDVDSKAQKKTN